MAPKVATPRKPVRRKSGRNANDESGAQDASDQAPSTIAHIPIPRGFSIGGLQLEGSDTSPGTSGHDEPAEQDSTPQGEPAEEHTYSEAMEVDSQPQAPRTMPDPVPPTEPGSEPSQSSRPAPPVQRKSGAPNAIRRSKLARDAAEAAEKARQAANLQKAPKAMPPIGDSGFDRGRGGRGRGRGRGGRLGEAPSREAVGLFGSGRAETEHISRPKPRTSHSQLVGRESGPLSDRSPGAAGQPGPSSSRSDRRKTKVKTEGGEENNGKRHYNTDSSSSESGTDDELAGVRKNVDYIDLLSDDEADGTEANGAVKPMQPIRVLRVEHQDRQAVSVAKSSKVDRKRTLKNLKARDPNTDKGKQRAGEPELVRTERRWKGAYSDGDSDDDDDAINVKSEPDLLLPPDATVDPSADPSNQEDRKVRSRRGPGADLQTPEERAEHARHVSSKERIVYELGPMPADTSSSTAAAADRDHRAERVYLFQFPPVLPLLSGPNLKPDPDAQSGSDALDASMSGDVHSAPPLPATSDAAPAVAAATVSNTIDVPPDAPPAVVVKPDPDPAADVQGRNKSTTASLPPGRVGKLRVHASGRVTLDWGGTALQLELGADMDFPQDVVLVRPFADGKVEELRSNGTGGKLGKGKGKARDGDGGDAAAQGAGDKGDVVQGDGLVGGEAFAVGGVRGKFVVTPDWAEIL